MAAAKAASSIPVGNNNPASIAARREAGGYAKIGAREHTINAIKGFDRQPLPLDLYLRAYFFKEAPDIAKNLTMRWIEKKMVSTLLKFYFIDVKLLRLLLGWLHGRVCSTTFAILQAQSLSPGKKGKFSLCLVFLHWFQLFVCSGMKSWCKFEIQSRWWTIPSFQVSVPSNIIRFFLRCLN